MEGFLPPPGTTININSTQNIHISQPTHIQLTINNPTSLLSNSTGGDSPHQ